jgi:hypothetical protein
MIDWNDTPVLDEPLPRNADELVSVESIPYFVVAESGLHMLVAALAGADNVCRVVGTRRGPVQVIEQSPDGDRRWLEPWTSADDGIIDDDLAEYLGDAGVPAPPRGYTWLQRLPAGFTGGADVSRYVNRRLAEADPTWVHPEQVKAFIEPIVADLYQ